MRFLSAIPALCLAVGAGMLQGQQRTLHVQLAAGGAATGGGGYRDNGGVFGRFGFDFAVRPGLSVQTNASLFARLVNSDCADSSSQCGNSFPSPITTITVDAVHTVSAAPFAGHPIALGVGLGPAFVGSSTGLPSVTAIAGDVGAEITVLGGRRAAFVFGAHAMLIPDVFQHTIWLVPLTVGVRL